MSLYEKDGPFPFELAKGQTQSVYEVDDVRLRVIALNGPRFVLITAVGIVVTRGWTNPRLQPFVYIQPPADGVWDFLFVADPPDKPVPEVLSPIATTYVLSMPSNFAGVKVHSATNVVEQSAKGVQSEDIKSKYKIGTALSL